MRHGRPLIGPDLESVVWAAVVTEDKSRQHGSPRVGWVPSHPPASALWTILSRSGRCNANSICWRALPCPHFPGLAPISQVGKDIESVCVGMRVLL